MRGIEFLGIIVVGAALSVMTTVSAVDRNRVAGMPTQPGWSPAWYPAPSRPETPELDVQDAQEQESPAPGPQASRTNEPNIAGDGANRDGIAREIGKTSRAAADADHRQAEHVPNQSWQERDAAKQSALKMEGYARETDLAAYANRSAAQQAAYANRAAAQRNDDLEYERQTYLNGLAQLEADRVFAQQAMQVTRHGATSMTTEN